MSKSNLKNIKTEAELLKKQQEEINILKTDNDILRNIIAMIPGNVYWKDKEGKFLGCNNNVAGILGLVSPSEIIGKRNRDLFDTRLAYLADQVDKLVSKSSAEKYVEEIGLSFNNEPAIYLSKKLPLYDNFGKIVGILGVSFDITERKKMEEDLKIAKEKAERLSRAKSQFLAVVNHELRTPLASIIGLIEFLKQGQLTKIAEKNIVHAIENCTQHLLGLVNEILEFSRLDAGKYSIRFNIVDLNSLLHEVYSITNTLAQKKQLEFKIQLGANIPKHITTDGKILRQILINLVSNAIKFTEHGFVTVSVINLARLDNKLRIEFAIADSGVGIPREKLRLIFEPFQQLEDPYVRQSSRSGTGLGLSIVDKLTMLIGAKTHVKSKIGKGSVFSVIGEFVVPEHELEQSSPPQTLIMETTLKKQKKKTKAVKNNLQKLTDKKPNVLLIEDDPIVQYVHTKMLTDLGCHVSAYTNGLEAIKHLAKYDIIFVDISLPDLSGFEVIKLIRKKIKCKNTPIVALTVYTGKEEKKAAAEAGADEFTSKPISQGYLKKLLLRYVYQ